MFGIKGWEWIIILVVVLLIFGPSKLPSLARSIGKSITEFRGGIRQAQDDITKLADEDLKGKSLNELKKELAALQAEEQETLVEA